MYSLTIIASMYFPGCEIAVPFVHVLKGTVTYTGLAQCALVGTILLTTFFNRLLYVYNDDVTIFSNTIHDLIQISQSFHDPNKHIVVGAFASTTKQVTYGGLRRSSWIHPLKFSLVEPLNTQSLSLDTFNMNSALIPIHILNTIEFIPSYFIHGALTTTLVFEHGNVVFPSTYPNLMSELVHATFIKKTGFQYPLPSLDSYRTLCSPKHQPIKSRFHYYRNHGGSVWFILFLLPYIFLPMKYISTNSSNLPIRFLNIYITGRDSPLISPIDVSSSIFLLPLFFKLLNSLPDWFFFLRPIVHNL